MNKAEEFIPVKSKPESTAKLPNVIPLKADSDTAGSVYIDSEASALYYDDLFNRQFYTGKKLINHWQPTMIYDLPERDISRVTFSGQEYWVLNEKACEVLKSVLADNIELLPLISQEEIHKKLSFKQRTWLRKAYKPLIESICPVPHFMVNILDTQSVDIISFKKSDFKFDKKSEEIYFLNTLVFKRKKTEHLALFKIMGHGRYLELSTFMSQKIKTIIQQNDLTGLQFSEYPEG